MKKVANTKINTKTHMYKQNIKNIKRHLKQKYAKTNKSTITENEKHMDTSKHN